MKKSFFPFALAILFFMGCKKDEEETHWDYENPQWQSQGYSDCAGLVQSPINIVTTETIKANLPTINFNYSAFNASSLDNGHTLQINNVGNSQVTYNGKPYKLKQFHFHAKSEHKIDGSQSPVEIHFVHQNESNGTLLVLGVMLDGSGSDNAGIAKYLSSLPTEKMKEMATTISIDPNLLFPASKKYYNYTGSLTTPPCSQGLNWIVLKDKLPVSAAQIAGFEKIYNHNYRPIQETGSRTVFESL